MAGRALRFCQQPRKRAAVSLDSLCRLLATQGRDFPPRILGQMTSLGEFRTRDASLMLKSETRHRLSRTGSEADPWFHPQLKGVPGCQKAGSEIAHLRAGEKSDWRAPFSGQSPALTVSGSWSPALIDPLPSHAARQNTVISPGAYLVLTRGNQLSVRCSI